MTESRHTDRQPEGSMTCPHCGRSVTVPDSGDWISADTVEILDRLLAFPCPHCNEQIRLDG
jgi:predicted RNA-binding Zn-ribbon protein involved in translation (DUF1610 family)